MQTKEFDVIDYLDSQEAIHLYLQEVLSNGGSLNHIKQAFADAERARARLADTEPSLSTIDMIFDALAQTNKPLMI